MHEPLYGNPRGYQTQEEKLLELVKGTEQEEVDALFQQLFPAVLEADQSDSGSESTELPSASKEFVERQRQKQEIIQNKIRCAGYIVRAFSILPQVSQWGLLFVDIAQIPDAGNEHMPDWLKSLISPWAVLLSGSLMNAVVTWYLVDLERIIQAYSPYKAIFQAGVKPQLKAKMAITALFGMALAVAGAAYFLPIVTEPEQLSNKSFPLLVAYYQWLENDETGQAINLVTFWIVNVLVQACSGLSLAESLINFLVYYFLKPVQREANRIQQDIIEVARTPDLSHLFQVIKRHYVHKEVSLQDFLDEMNGKLSNSFLLIAALYAKQRQSGCSKIGFDLLRTSITAAIIYGFTFLSLAALRKLPLYVALSSIMVSVDLLDRFSKAEVESLKSLPRKEKPRQSHWTITGLMGVISTLFLFYTGLVSLPKVFEEALANCILLENATEYPMHNQTQPCPENSQLWFYAQLALSVLTIVLFNIEPVVSVMAQIDKAILKRLAEKSQQQKEKLQWNHFMRLQKNKLIRCSGSPAFMADFLLDCLSKDGQINQLLLLLNYQNKPMVPVQGVEEGVEEIFSHLLKQVPSRRRASLSFSGNRGATLVSRNIGSLIPLKERSRGWRIGSDLIGLLFFAGAFAYSVAAYDKNDPNPMHRLMNLINFLEQDVWAPLTLLWLAHFIPRLILSVRSCREKSATYWDKNARLCGKAPRDIKMVRSLVSNRGCGVAACLVSVALFPKMYFTYHALSIALAANVELDFVDFEEDTREITESFFQFLLLGMVLLVNNNMADKIQGSLSTACCFKTAKPGNANFIREGSSEEKQEKATTYGSINLVSMGAIKV
jgi:hypothetical protein